VGKVARTGEEMTVILLGTISGLILSAIIAKLDGLDDLKDPEDPDNDWN
jgi:hypothetical protein